MARHLSRSVAAVGLAIVVAFSSACVGPTDPTFVGLTQVYVSASTGYGRSAQVAIADQATWESAWAEIHSKSISKPIVPVVDFNTELVLLAAMGGRSTGGYSVVYSGASADRGILTVDVVMVSPGHNCVVTLGITSPVNIAKVSRAQTGSRNPTVQFRVHDTVLDCLKP